MKIFCVKNRGETYVVFSPNDAPPNRISEDRWVSVNGSTWVPLGDKASCFKWLLDLIDLSDVPEPSISDETPMELHYKPIRVSYSYDD